MRKVPGWGKIIGIIMIVLGALGVFLQFYKISLPTFANLQGEILNDLDGLSGPKKVGIKIFDSMFGMSQTQGNVMITLGIFGLIACTLYIISGTKLLKAEPKNYNFAKFTLIGFLIFNLINVVWMGMNNNSVMIMGIMVYVLVGLVFDIVITIILLSNDKSAYGIGEPQSSSHIIDDENEFEID